MFNFTPLEIFYIILTVIATGYIFSSVFKNYNNPKKEDLFNKYKLFNWEDIKWSIIIASPGIVLHELAHKFVALAFGLSAHYEIYPTGLIIGTILRALNLGFIFLAPGYVTIVNATEIQSVLTALAGPLTNCLLWLIPILILKYNKKLKQKTVFILTATGQINKWLFIFNMIPIPPLDGSKVILPLLGIFF